MSQLEKINSTFHTTNTSVNGFIKEKFQLLEDYFNGQKCFVSRLKETENLTGNSIRTTISSEGTRILPSNAGAISDENVVSSTVSSNKRRGERASAKVACLKVKKNLNKSRNFRQPSTSFFQGAMRDEENNILVPIVDVTNGQTRTTRTKTIRKCKRSEVLHLPDASLTVRSNNIENNIPVNETNFPAIVIPAISSPRSHSSSPGPSSVKMRAKHFENIAKYNKSCSQKSLLIQPNIQETDSTNNKFVVVQNNAVNEKEIVKVVEHNDNQNDKELVLSEAFKPSSETVQQEERNEISSQSSTSSINFKSPDLPDSNKTYGSQPKNNPITEVTRITRAMAQNSKKEESDTTASSSMSNSSSSSKSSKRKGVKKSSVSFKCKKSIKSARLMESALKKKVAASNHAVTKSAIPRAKKGNHEERLNKVREAREERLRKQHDAEVAAQKKKAEKMMAAAAERERLLKEEEAKKAAIAKQKKLEMEERRKREEAARLARLEEIEEEHKRAAAAVKKKKEENAIHQKKQTQETRVAAMKHQGQEIAKPQTPNANNKTTVKPANVTHIVESDSNNYELTPSREDRVLKNPKTLNDYGIDEIGSSDSSDNEDHPKKKIPLWAKKENRVILTRHSSYVPLSIWNILYKCDINPSVFQLMGINNFKRPRTSSAVWHIPPLLKK